MKKLEILLIIFTVFLSVAISTNVSAAKSGEEAASNDVVLTTEKSEEAIALYKNIADETPFKSLPNKTTVTLAEKVNTDFSLVRYTDEAGNTAVGYVKNENIIFDTEQADSASVETDQESASKNEEKTTSHNTAQSEDNTSKQTLAAVSSANAGTTLYGYAIKAPTKVYKTTTDRSNVAHTDILKSYPKGSYLKYRTYSSNWYIATVYVDGKAHTGYIHKDDVSENKPTLQGYAQKQPTAVYADPSRDAKVLKDYPSAHLLKFRPYSSTWYAATVYLNGKPHTGFIHQDDVTSEQPALHGYAQLDRTHVYASTSKTSKSLKDYPAGSLLKYRDYNSKWYEATVYLNGVATTGYIYKNDVGATKPTYKGYAQIEVTAVFEKMSTTSKVLKSYRAGSLLKYRAHNSEWYEATVYLDGIAHTGYIHRDHVGDTIPTLAGFADQNPTPVYSDTTRNARVLKSYKKGHLLKYKPYSASWYIATVYINGKATTGYIHRDDVVQPVGKTVVIDAGHGGSDPGASGNGLREKDVVLELALKTETALKQAGFDVVMTRTTDEFLQLQERTAIANNSNAHLFLSIHINAGGGTGIETWWYSKGPKPNESKDFAQSLQDEVIRATNETNRGIKDGNLHINRESKVPSALLEVGFIDHANDSEKLKQTKHKNNIVKGIINGIKRYFKIPF